MSEHASTTLSSNNQSMLRSTTVVSSCTMISRLLGFVRDMVIAHLFGADAGMDAFVVAFKIPQFLRRLFAEGAFSQAFVPVLSEYRQSRPKAEVKQLINATAGILALSLLLVVMVAVLTTPWILKAFAPGFATEGLRFTLASHLLRITFPYLLLISLTAFAGGVLNTYEIFSVPAFTPVLLNVCLIFAAIVMRQWFAVPIHALAYGVLLAGVAQLFFQVPFLQAKKLLPRPRVNFADPGVKRILRLMGPAILGVSVAQISLLIDTLFASFLKVGSVSWLYYSERLMSFPLGVFGVALSTVMLPNLSRHFAAKEHRAYAQTTQWAIRWVFLIGLPAAVGLALLANPLLITLFRYGAFHAHDVAMARLSLIAYAVGVPGFMLVKVLASGFYAQQNIRTPVRIAMIALVVNMLLNVVLIVPLQHAGLALATTLSSMLNAALLWRKLDLVDRASAKKWGIFLLRVSLATVAMAVFLIWLRSPLSQWLAWQAWQRVGHLLLLVGSGAIIYTLGLLLLGLKLQPTPSQDP